MPRTTVYRHTFSGRLLTRSHFIRVSECQCGRREYFASVIPTTMGQGFQDISNLVVLALPLTQEHLARLQEHFKSVVVAPEWSGGAVSEEQLAQADAILGFPHAYIKSLDQVPNLRFLQLPSAGSDFLLKNPTWKDERAKRITIASSAGLHGVVPQHVIAVLLALAHRLQEQLHNTYAEKRWHRIFNLQASGHWELRGKTVGVIGYGHIGRESARLAKAFGAIIIAANTSGTRKAQHGYFIPGTGDSDGSLPTEWYSTADPQSLATLLSKSDVVILSLPSTPATRHILNATTLAYLKPSAVIVNVGRGDAIHTEALVQALDDGKIAGAALDVTEPEPLPDGHTLFGRPNVIITPHTSGHAADYANASIDVFLANVQRWREGKELFNVVDLERGY